MTWFLWYIYIPLCPRFSSSVFPSLCLVQCMVSSEVSLTVSFLNDSDARETLGNQVKVSAAIECQRRAASSWALPTF